MLAAGYFTSAVSAESAVRIRTAAIPHDVALAAGDAGSALRETCPEGAFPLAVLAAWGKRQQRYGQDSRAKK